MPAAQVEVFGGRRGTDVHGCRFHLNPSRFEFARFFAGLHGAAFIRMGDDVSFGAGPDGSIDHSTIARSFALTGDEVFRGYAKADGGAQIEVWVDAEDETLLDDAHRARIDACVDAALADRCLSRIPGTRELVVFSTEHGQPIIERELPAAV